MVLTDRGPRDREGAVDSSKLSHDGKMVAYVRDFPLSKRIDLYVAGADGRSSRLIHRFGDATAVNLLDWSRDGRLVLVSVTTSSHVELHSIDVKTGQVDHYWRLPLDRTISALYVPDGSGVVWGSEFAAGPQFLGHDQKPRFETLPRRERSLPAGWSADGKTLYYASDQAGTMDLWGADVSGGKAPALLFRSVGKIRPLRVAQDGSLYFALDTPLMSVNRVPIDPASGAPSGSVETVSKQLDCHNDRGTWASDGRIAWTCTHKTGPDRISVADQNGRVRDLSSRRQTLEWLRWAPDGRSLLVGGNGLVAMDADSGETRMLQPGSASEWVPEGALTPDGTKLIFKLRMRLAEPSRLMVRDLATDAQEELLPSIYRFDLAPDGKRLAYCTFDDDNEYIRILTLADRSIQEVHREERNGRINSISLAPDGKHIYYSQRERAHRVNVASGRVEHLPLQMEGLRDLKIHPNGRWASFTAGPAQRSEVRRLRLAGLR